MGTDNCIELLGRERQRSRIRNLRRVVFGGERDHSRVKIDANHVVAAREKHLAKPSLPAANIKDIQRRRRQQLDHRIQCR